MKGREKMKESHHGYPMKGLSDFSFEVHYYDGIPSSPKNTMQMQSHNVYELYVHLSGDISFMVGTRLYPIYPGDLILLRPGEAHQCIIHENTLRRYFTFFITDLEFLSEALGATGSGKNILSLPHEKMQRFVSLCRELCDGVDDRINVYRHLFEVIELLEYACRLPDARSDTTLPPDVNTVIRLIEEDIARPLTVREMAQEAFVSINTLERHFRQTMNLSPTEYLKQKRLIFARNLLYDGCSVQSACEQSGFSDCSHFISLFREVFGTTPLKYKNQIKEL